MRIMSFVKCIFLLVLVVITLRAQVTQAAADDLGKEFRSYREIFKYVAGIESLRSVPLENVDEDVILKLAAESTIIIRPAGDGAPALWVLKAQFYGSRDKEGHDSLRGATGNGPLYIFSRVGGRDSASSDVFKLVGSAYASSYRWKTWDGRLMLVAERKSGRDVLTQEYVWDGGMLRGHD